MKRLIALVLLLVAQVASAEPRRFAVVVGTNEGDAEDEPLHYAEADAQHVRDALVEIGGARAEDVTILVHAQADTVMAALESVDRKIRGRAVPGDQLIVYASGHADSGALHLAGTHLQLHALTEFMRQSAATVALLILDSCRAGSATHVKGLEPLEGTRVNVELPEVSGRVVIGASGPDEYAQESDALQSSFFTHHFLAGMRGAADVSHDGVVTLQEAYSYAYALTVESTFGTRGGVQHPSFSEDLHGEGDLVLAEPSHARGRLRIAVAQAGEWLLYTARGSSVAGQFEKPEGETVIALAPGSYRILERTGRGFLEQSITVPDGGETVVTESTLSPSSFTETASKGAPARHLEIAIGPSMGNGITSHVPVAGGLAIWTEWEQPLGIPITALDIDLLVRTASTHEVLSYREESVELRGGPAWALRAGRVTLSAAAMLGEGLVRQVSLSGFDGRPSFVPELGLSPRARVSVFGPVALSATAFAGGDAVSTDQGRFFRPRADVQVGLGFAL